MSPSPDDIDSSTIWSPGVAVSFTVLGVAVRPTILELQQSRHHSVNSVARGPFIVNKFTRSLAH